MRTVLVVLLLCATAAYAPAQSTHSTPGVGAVAATWGKLYIGPPNIVKTVDFVSYEATTDTIKFCYSKGDTGNILRQTLLLPSQTLRDYNVKADTVWYKGSGTSTWFVRAMTQ